MPTDAEQDSASAPEHTQAALSDADRERILLEERYRVQVRRQLEAATTSRRASLWAFANSNFALWLLSAVFLTGLGAAYNRYHEDAKEDAARRAVVERLDTEITFRISRVLAATRRLVIAGNRKRAFEYELRTSTKRPSPSEGSRLKEEIAADEKIISETPNRYELLRSAPSASYPALYPEYAAASLPTLVAELRNHVDEAQRRQLDQVIASLVKHKFGTGRPLCTEAEEINQTFLLPRWKALPFDYVSCPFTSPFCEIYFDAGEWWINPGTCARDRATLARPRRWVPPVSSSSY